MAKIVIAGKADCPYYARSELLGDKLSRNLPNFNLHKIVKQPSEWDTWLKNTCNERGWNHKKSPLVWRELIDRGGKGVLIGGANEFQEYANGYYGVESELMSTDMQKICKENLGYKIEMDKEASEFLALSKPLHVCITVAASSACYSMLGDISRGEVFGKNTELALHLYDSSDKMEVLEGVRMEIFDLALGIVREITITSDIKDAFRNCGAIVLMDEIIQTDGEDKAAWIKKNSAHFVNYAKIINDVAKKNVKVLLAGNGPVNLNTFMMIENAPNIPRQNFVGLSRIVENHAKAIIAKKVNINSSGVVDVVVWGNVNGENYIDLTKSRIHGYEGAIWGPPSFSLPTTEMVWDKQWLGKDFLEQVKNRKQTVEETLKHTAAMAHADAINTMMKHWWNGSPSGQMFSLAVCSDGWYDVPKGLVCSFPVAMHPKGYWYVVEDIEIPEETKEKIQAAVQDLISEKEVIFPPPKPPTPPPGEVKVTIIDPKESSTEDTTTSDSSEKKTDDTSGTSELETDPSSDAKLATIVEEKNANDNNGNNLQNDEQEVKPELENAEEAKPQEEPAEN